MNTKNQSNVFIIDDDKIFATALKTSIGPSLKNVSAKIHLFDTGEKAIERFRELKPELVILDYFLNSESSAAMDGIRILDKIKKINVETSVIMLTSDDSIDTAIKSFHYGAADYIVKTESQFEKVNHSITNILASKELVLQNKEKEKRAFDLLIANKELSIQNKEREKRAAELINAYKEIVFQHEEKEKRTAELIIANKELAFQKEEREKRSTELRIANIQKAEAEKSKLAIEKKNKDITDSINYAKRIQQAKLPGKEKIYASLPQSFVLFKPKDVVSGDFYFFHKNNESVFIVAADCTGHGVPGALMSMIGSEKLRDAVSKSTCTSEILKDLNIGIKNSLNQSDSHDHTQDGMDIAICSLDLEKRIVKYSGANRPLWVIRKGTEEVEEIKGTKKSIGGWTDDNQHFDSHELKLQQNDTFYLSSDGYADQFGGQEGKKLMSKKFKKMLLDIQDKSMPEQEKHLDSFVEEWRGDVEQVDDILVIGVRL